MRYLTLAELLELHRRVIEQSGGAEGVRDLGLAESAIAQPQMAFSGADLYSSLVDKAAALGFSLVRNHAFVDGNKRMGHAAMETFLFLNGAELNAGIDESETIILRLAAGELSRGELVNWLNSRVISLT